MFMGRPGDLNLKNVGGEQGLMGGHKSGQVGAKKPPADPMVPVAQNLGQNGQWKAEKPRLERAGWVAHLKRLW
jgi:hypothetical protein